MPPSDFRPRLTIDLREDQCEALRKILPHGTKVILFRALVDGLIELYNKDGFTPISEIISGSVNVMQLAEAGKPYTHKVLSPEG